MAKKSSSYNNPLTIIPQKPEEAEKLSFVTKAEPTQEQDTTPVKQEPKVSKSNAEDQEKITEQLTIYLTLSQLEKLYSLQEGYRRKHHKNITLIEIVRQAVNKIEQDDLQPPKRKTKSSQ